MKNVFSYIALARAGWVLTREGVIASLPANDLNGFPKFMHKLACSLARKRSKQLERSKRLSIALHKLGPSWVKLGEAGSVFGNPA